MILILNEDKPIIKSETQNFLFDKIVIACGAFSKKLNRQFGRKNTT